ncbi:MAG TPA: protein kinase [Pyrinomonadaceae bacterium]|nr:protein kinase [Pyrinomonadaceae bacterium]
MNKEFPPDTPLSHYRIVSKLGTGGMGEVYLAQDVELDRQVALKVLLAEVAENEDRVRRFIQEAKAASALNHPNILTVYEIGYFENTRFIAAELVKGKTLHDRLRGEPLTLREKLDVALQVAAALSAAHSAGIVHRDIKPENIMLRDDGLVKVLDFGLAKLTNDRNSDRETHEEAQTRMKRQTRPGVVMGTVSYMSPEQARGKEIDARSDIWSLGVVLYEMLTGRTPFAGESMNDSIAAILTKDPAPLDTQTPTELQRIVRKSLQKNTDERYQTVKDLQLDLKNLKRELEFSEELERSQVPQSLASANVSIGSPGENATSVQSSAAPTQGSLQSQQRSSAEYIVGEIKSHKAILAVLSVVFITLLAGGFWLWRGGRVSGSDQINSIAVLPFENRSGNPDSEYLSDGIAESLIYRLSQLPNLKVSPSSSVFRFKGKQVDVQQIASELGVSAVMSGRLVQRGDNLTISVELIDVKKDQVLWGEQFERKTSELLTTQREIATAITQKLQLKLSGSETGLTKKYTTDNEAYQHYLQGRFYWNRRTGENVKKAIEQFKAAADKDPGFALAYAGLGDCYAIASTYTGKRASETLPLAKSNAMRAIELDSSLAEPHATLGMINHFTGQMAEAEIEFKRAIELNPNYATAHHWYSRMLRAVGRADEAWAEIHRASELDPLSLVMLNNIAEQEIERGNLTAAVNECNRMFDLDPNFWAAHQTFAIVLMKQGRNTEALAEMQKSIDLSNRSNASLSFLAHINGVAGKRSEAESLIKELEERYNKGEADGRDLAVAYAGLDDKDKAFAWLEKAFSDRSNFIAVLRLEPALDSLHSDPRWNDLLKRAGVAQ